MQRVFLISLITLCGIVPLKAVNVFRVPGEYPTIQEAVDACEASDIILISPGTYTGDGNRDVLIDQKEIVIKGDTTDPSEVIIDVQGSPESSHRAFNFIAPEYQRNLNQIRNITVRGGYAILENDGVGGGVNITGNDFLIDSCRFENNLADDRGGGINFLGDGILICENTVFLNNSTTLNRGRGGGLHAGSAIINACYFENNYSHNSAAAKISQGIVTNSTFISNTADRDAAGLSISDYGQVDNCVFAFNESGVGAGISCAYSDFITVCNSLFYENHVTGGAAACNLWGLIEFRLTNNLFVNNSSDYSGGAISVNSYWGLIENCTFYGNSAGYVAGSIHFWGTYGIDIVNTILWNNNAPNAPEMLLEYMPQTGVPSIVNIDYSLMAPDTSILEEYCELNLGSKIIDSDPYLVDPEIENFRLSYKSPCIDNGSDTGLHSSVDHFGDSRIVGNSVDIGAHEYQEQLTRGAYLFMEDVALEAGDLFILDLVAASDYWGQQVSIVVALEVGGVYFFYPNWTRSLETKDEVAKYGRLWLGLFDFSWPANAGSQTGLSIWSAILNPDDFSIIGEIDCVDWGYY